MIQVSCTSSYKFEQSSLWTNEKVCKEGSCGHLNSEYNLCDMLKCQRLLSSQTCSLVQKGFCSNLQDVHDTWFIGINLEIRNYCGKKLYLIKNWSLVFNFLVHFLHFVSLFLFVFFLIAVGFISFYATVTIRTVFFIFHVREWF